MRIPEPTAKRDSEEKHGRLEGGALTEEALDSSRSILGLGRGPKGTVRGLQQWFTPAKIANFVAAVIGRSIPTLDFTAGSGAMLAGFEEDHRFGVEIDSDHVNDAYLAIHADAQKAVPMLRAAGVKFPAVAINPPFGLDWHDPVHAKSRINSTRLSFLWSLDLMRDGGQGAMLCGTNRLAREVMSLPEADSVYAVVDIEGRIWENVDIPCSLVFYTRPDNMKRSWTPSERRLRISASMDDLMRLAREVVCAREGAVCYITSRVVPNALNQLRRDFKYVATEYGRRRSQAVQKAGGKPRFDLSLKGGKISAHPGAYARLALNKACILREIELLNNQSINYFACNPKAWRIAEKAGADGAITISEALKSKVAEVIEGVERVSKPLFPLKPQMRLGWLTELDRITCRKDDPAKGFAAGNTYSLDTQSVIQTDSEERIVENKSGEKELRKFTSERKLLQIKINAGFGGDGGKPQVFNESPENIRCLIDHFDVPDPGDVASLYPDLVERMRKLLEDIESENGFTLKEFQKDHMSRLLTKERGLLAHEQGLGKTLMLMTLAEASVKLGAKNRALFVVPQDLIPQWQREAKKFFGRELQEIRDAGQARKVARNLKDGGAGWFITYYEALSIVGRKREPLPPVDLDPADDLRRRLAAHKEAKRVKSLHGTSWRVGAAGIKDPKASKEEEKRPAKRASGTSKWACPKCLTDTAAKPGWDGEVCGECHYVHRRLLSSPHTRTSARLS